jgi:hypothetical protein
MKNTYIKSTITLAGRINTANKGTVGTIFFANSSPALDNPARIFIIRSQSLQACRD